MGKLNGRTIFYVTLVFDNKEFDPPELTKEYVMKILEKTRAISERLTKGVSVKVSKQPDRLEEKLKVAESYIYQPDDFYEYREELKHRNLPDSEPAE